MASQKCNLSLCPLWLALTSHEPFPPRTSLCFLLANDTGCVSGCGPMSTSHQANSPSHLLRSSSSAEIRTHTVLLARVLMSSSLLGSPNVFWLDLLHTSLTQSTNRQVSSTFPCSPKSFPVPASLLYLPAVSPVSLGCQQWLLLHKASVVLCRPYPAARKPLRRPIPETEQGNPWSRTSSRAQKACSSGPWQLAWHMPDMASLKAACLPSWKLTLSEGSEGAGILSS